MPFSQHLAFDTNLINPNVMKGGGWRVGKRKRQERVYCLNGTISIKAE